MSTGTCSNSWASGMRGFIAENTSKSGALCGMAVVGMGRRSALRGRRDGATIRDAWSWPRTRARPEEPQPSIEGESWKEGEGVERDAGASRGYKKTAAQRLSTTIYYHHNLSVGTHPVVL